MTNIFFVFLNISMVLLSGLAACSFNEVRSPASSPALTRQEIIDIHDECNGMVGCMIDRLGMYQDSRGDLSGPRDPQRVELYRSSNCQNDINGKNALAIALHFPNQTEPAMDTSQDERCLEVNESLKLSVNIFKQGNEGGGYTQITNGIRAYKINGGSCIKLRTHSLDEYCQLDTYNELTQAFSRNDY